MTRITNAFIEQLGINGSDMSEWKPVKEAEPTVLIQLLISLYDVRILPENVAYNISTGAIASCAL